MTEPEAADNTELTEPEAADNTELDAESESDDALPSINEEDAEEKASADYQQRMEEFDAVDSTPITSVPATGQSGTVEMPKS